MHAMVQSTGKSTSLLVDDAGALIVTGGGGGGGGGGDASASNQVITNTKLDTLHTDNGTQNTKIDAITTAVGTGNTSLAGIKTDADTLVARTPTLGRKPTSGGVPATAKSGGDKFQTVAASTSAQALGTSTGAAGDYIEGILCVVATAATSGVTLADGSGTAFTIHPDAVGAGVGSYYIPLGLTSVSGGWKVTTHAGVSVVCMGDFT